MKRGFFRVLAKINRKIFPSYADKDLGRLTSKDKLIIAYRYWVTKNALGD